MTKRKYRALKQRVHDAGLSLARVCRVADINQTTLVRWQSGDAKPRPSTWAKVENAIDVLIAERDRKALAEARR